MGKSFIHAFEKPWVYRLNRPKSEELDMEMFLMSFTVFVLAIFVGFEVITKIPPTLHTPLMSGSNAISGITLVGAIVSTGTELWITTVLGFLSVVLATINVIGGFMVTNRMLAMFKKKS